MARGRRLGAAIGWRRSLARKSAPSRRPETLADPALVRQQNPEPG
ncbi:hypothetical protein [Amycolatopsis kentuckyensis]